MFRCVIVKYWVMDNSSITCFHPCNKVLTKNFIKHYHECWEIRCVALHSQDMQKKVLKEDFLAMIEEASKDEMTGLRRHAEVHKTNENNATIEEMTSWVRSVRMFKRRATKRVNQDVRNMINVRVN